MKYENTDFYFPPKLIFLPLISINVHLISRKVAYMMEELEVMLN